MPRRVAFILNPAAGGGQSHWRWADLRGALARAGLAGEAHVTTGPGETAGLARHVASRVDLVVAVGGDGTVAEVASGLLQAAGPAVMGIVPTGTGNDVATQLGIRSCAHAVQVLSRGIPRCLDAIEVSSREHGRPVLRHALLFASVGFAGELLRQTTPRVKRWFGPRFCYSVGFLRALVTYRAPLVRVETDAASFAGRWLHICAGNSEWAGGGAMHLSPGARWDDGQLDLCLVQAMSRLAAAAHFPKLVRGTFVGHPRVRYFRGTRLTVDADPPVPLQLDGDLAGSTPATFTIRPGCLPVVAGG